VDALVIISEAKANEALEVILGSSETLGQLAGAEVWAEHAVKMEKALVFLRESGTVAERNARAEADAEVAHRVRDLQAIKHEKYAHINKVKAAYAVLEAWRTDSANNRTVMT
jgi:hypothetical protein